MNRKPFDINKEDRKLAILIDPEKEVLDDLPLKLNKLKQSSFDLILVGGSTVTTEQMDKCCKVIMKQNLPQPVVVFPGGAHQVTPYCDGLLFLSLISGRNPEFLIEQQVQSVEAIQQHQLPFLSTGYILIDGGKKTAVSKISNTTPMDQYDISSIEKTAVAGTMIGMSAIYMDAGSGAVEKVRPEIIQTVSSSIDIPLIVGGGIRTAEDIQKAYDSGANLIVIGNHIEEHPEFIESV